MRVLLLAALSLSLLASCERETRHPHSVRTTQLKTPDTAASLRPMHGAIVHTWGIATDILIVIDFDASTVRVKRDESMMGGQPTHSDHTEKLASEKLAAAKTAAFAAWHEDATGPTPQATDIREDLIVIDGDEAFYLSGYPISASMPEEKTGRPAAAKAMDVIYRLEDAD